MNSLQRSERIGLYAWGGPGTIRLLQTKYHSPVIDEKSFLMLYDTHMLRRAKSVFGVTDMWVTYSWGFSDETEKKDRKFLRDRLENFRVQKIHTHAYVQGLNVVADDFIGRDLFCRDFNGRFLPYSKGRSFTCPNNPHAAALIRRRVEDACAEDIDGVFVDNILFGLPPFYWRRDFVSFFGCSCTFCRTAFRTMFGYSLPMRSIKDQRVLADYRKFRAVSTARLVGELSGIVASAHRQFGVNLYDPFHHTPEIYFGYSLQDILPKLSYVLIENHALDFAGNVHNGHLAPLLAQKKKPVFVVSYRQGIGIDAQMTQEDLDALWTDAQTRGYFPCYKATEYKTHGIWHAARFDGLRKPHMRVSGDILHHIKKEKQKKSSGAGRIGTRILGRYYATVMRHVFERRLASEAVLRTGMYSRTLRTSGYFEEEKE